MPFMCLLLSSRSRLSSASVMFDFNDSLNDFAPVSPMSLPVYVMIMEKSELLMNVFCVFSFFCLHSPEWVSWVLCLTLMIHSMMLLLCLQSCCLLMRRKSDLLMDVFFLCLLSFVFTTQMEISECCVWFQRFTQWCCSCVSNLVGCRCNENRKEWIVDENHLRAFFCLHNLDWVWWVLCLISMIHSMMLLLCPQCCCLLMWWERKSDLLMNVFCVSSFFCPHHPDRVQWVLCLISMLHSMTLLPCPQCCCLLMWWE